MEKAGVPVVPGYHGERQDAKFLKEKAYEIGYPVLIKAVAGGGGKGMRRVDKHADFDDALEGAHARGAVRLRRRPGPDREIRRRAAPHRDSGLCRHARQRHPSQRARLLAAAPPPEGDRGSAGAGHDGRACARTWARPPSRPRKAVGYVGAGTVEFIADGAKRLRPDGFWFMEMNTRLQVEHPVTEAVTGLDLVEWQFRDRRRRSAAADAGAMSASTVTPSRRGFTPKIPSATSCRRPASRGAGIADGEGIRVDSGVEAGRRGHAVLRPDDRQVDRARRRRATGARPPRRGARSHGGRRARTMSAFLAALCRAHGFPGRPVRYRFHRPQSCRARRRPAWPDRGAAALGVARLLLPASHRRRETASEPYSPWDATRRLSALRTRAD